MSTGMSANNGVLRYRSPVSGSMHSTVEPCGASAHTFIAPANVPPAEGTHMTGREIAEYGEGVIKRLEGLDYTMTRQALMPDGRLVQWVLASLTQ